MKHKVYIWHSIICIVVLFLDQFSKAWIDTSMQLGQSIIVIPNFFSITYLHNTGAAWSMLEGKMLFFYIVSIIALIVMGYFYMNTDKEDMITKTGLVLMVSGTAGNFIDRIVFQHVRDFLDFTIFGYDFPVFNVADMALCIGVFLIFVSIGLEHFGGVRKCEK